MHFEPQTLLEHVIKLSDLAGLDDIHESVGSESQSGLVV